ncbi:hypothetical protein J8273_5889 [Carpediemonas membranifera]|uniref:Uncharacterized protein n=1 Tax=Carpediemonas membranifera TaxID=201153 RepID=A0A8J6AUF3_9EUKA|nr:hypothetical protein J8273_5889 [Carpediemonas membranifera]|eukprot:KAG9392750.1 hypothetical protein J8273_5889 [Carpediemonas membranifera]
MYKGIFRQHDYAVNTTDPVVLQQFRASSRPSLAESTISGYTNVLERLTSSQALATLGRRSQAQSLFCLVTGARPNEMAWAFTVQIHQTKTRAASEDDVDMRAAWVPLQAWPSEVGAALQHFLFLRREAGGTPLQLVFPRIGDEEPVQRDRIAAHTTTRLAAWRHEGLTSYSCHRTFVT